MLGVMKTAPGPGHVALGELPEPTPGPGQVKIAVKAAGICGTDLHIEDDEYPNWPPVVLGHEMAGEVVEVGSGVSSFSPGDRVTALPFAMHCGHCRYCLQGEYGLCAGRRSFGTGVNGAFAPYLVIPEGIVRRLPPEVDWESAALTEPLACCCKAVLQQGTVRAGDVALITGPGPIGLLALQLARLQGATTILLGTAHDAQRLAVGKRVGADYTVQAETDELWPLLDQLSHGRGADVVVECAGAPAATRAALRALRKQGQLIQVGLHGRPFEIDFEQIAYKDVQVIGSFASSTSSWERALTLLERQVLQLRPLISHVLPLEEWQKGFAMARSKEGLKVLFRPAT